MFELINKARVIWSMLTGKEIEVQDVESGHFYKVKYRVRARLFEITATVGSKSGSIKFKIVK